MPMENPTKISLMAEKVSKADILRLIDLVGPRMESDAFREMLSKGGCPFEMRDYATGFMVGMAMMLKLPIFPEECVHVDSNNIIIEVLHHLLSHNMSDEDKEHMKAWKEPIADILDKKFH